MDETNTWGQVLTLLVLFGGLALWVAIAHRRRTVRERQRMARLRRMHDVAQRTGEWPGQAWDDKPTLIGVKVSGVRRTVGPTSDQDRSEA